MDKAKSLCGILPALILAACAYPSNVVNDLAHMGDPTYDECRRKAGALSNYGADCAKEADPKVKAAKLEQARQAAEQQRRLTEAEQQKMVAQRSADAERGYTLISVRDFILDGKGLASRSAKLSLSGIYLPAGNLEVLFGTRIDAIQFARGDLPNGLAIHLLTDNAARDFRGQLLSCRSNPATSQIGCSVRILGVATTCVLSSPFGVRQEVPCVAVHEGSFRPLSRPYRDGIGCAS